MSTLREPTEKAFKAWVTYVFDHSVTDPAWHWKEDQSPYYFLESNSQFGIGYLIKLLENPVGYLEPYTDAQINQGLWFLSGIPCSDYMFAITDENIDIEHRIRLIKGIYTLYERIFAPRCSKHLKWMIRKGDDTSKHNPLNGTCYMWWDSIPFYARPDEPRWKPLELAALDVMEKTLRLNSLACQEGALHGLGHWAHQYPERVAEIIDAFLARTPDYAIHPDLRVYALDARRGAVL